MLLHATVPPSTNVIPSSEANPLLIPRSEAPPLVIPRSEATRDLLFAGGRSGSVREQRTRLHIRLDLLLASVASEEQIPRFARDDNEKEATRDRLLDVVFDIRTLPRARGNNAASRALSNCRCD